jgi:CTP:molybdopterin cytidylyltransferase MocA
MKLILLCGGRSERMGEPKGLLPVPDGDFFLLEQCASFFRAGGGHVTVVLGFGFDLYLERLGCRQTADGGFFFLYQNRKITCVINHNPQMGPFSSLQTGISSLYPEAVQTNVKVLEGRKKGKIMAEVKPHSTPFSRICKKNLKNDLTMKTPCSLDNKSYADGVFMLPVDVPCPGAGVFADLHQDNQNGIKVCVPVRAGRGGHPVWLSEVFCQTLLTVKLGENYRLDRQINMLSAQEIKRVDVQEDCVCYNLNRPEDWLRYLCERKELK